MTTETAAGILLVFLALVFMIAKLIRDGASTSDE